MRWRRYAVKLDCVPDFPFGGMRLRSMPAWLTASLCALMVLLLAGCASTSVLPVKSQAQSQTTARLQSYKLTSVSSSGQTEDTLLIVQPEAGGATRWIQTNALGAPLARLQLSDGAWRTDGFLPPNPTAQQLFEAIIASQIPRQQWASVYPDIDIASAQRDGRPVHTFSRQGRTLWTLQLSDENEDQSSAEYERKPPEQSRAAAAATGHATDSAHVTSIELPDQRRWQLTPLADSAAAPSAQDLQQTPEQSRKQIPAKNKTKSSAKNSTNTSAKSQSTTTSQTASETHQRRIPRLHPLEPQQNHDKKLPE